MTTKTEKADLSSLRIGHDKKDYRPEGGSRRTYVILAAGLLIVFVGFLLLKGMFKQPMEVEIASASLTYPSQASAVLTASGYVVAQKKASVASKGTGRLVYLGVEEGDQVNKGDVIARLEDQDVRAALDKSHADLQLARADSADAVLAFARQETLFTSGLTSQAERDGAKARILRVLASIKAAEAGVAAAEVALENTRIRAPFDGTVLTKDADVGEVVAPFASSASSRGAVVTMANMASLEVEADVSESNITRVRTGQPCEIVLDAYPDRRYSGYVHKIVPTADRAKATVLTKVRFRERDDRVLPEMSAKVHFLPTETVTDLTSDPVLTVPATAVVTRDGQDVVFLVRDETATVMRVVRGDRLGDRLVIREGLNQGDQVVVRPTSELSSGTRVKKKP